MKQSKSMRLMSILMILVMLSSIYASTTIARFSDVVQSTDFTRVAIWDINANEVTMDLFNTSYTDDVTGNILAKSYNNENIIAPGTHGTSLFSIVNHVGDIAPEVMYYIQIDLDDSNVSNDIITNQYIQWKLDNGSWGTWDQLKQSIYMLTGDPSGVKTYQAGEFANAFKKDMTHSISWQWLEDDIGNNTMTDEEDYIAKIAVKVTARQTSTVYSGAVEGVNNIVNVNEDIEPVVVKSSAPMNELVEVQVNGEVIERDVDYTVTEGSTIITLTESYLKTLPIGGYNISIVSQKQVAVAKLDIVDRVYSFEEDTYDPSEVSNILSENSWGLISKVVGSGDTSKYWSIGDKTTVDVNGTDYEVAIAGINHDGENTVTFVFTENVGTAVMNDEMTNSGSWENSKMRTVTIPEILAQMENKDLIKEVEKKTIKGYADGQADDSAYDLIITNDKLFLLSYNEVFGKQYNEDWENFNEGTQYEYFKNPANRVIEPGEDGEGVWWWLRTPNGAYEDSFYYVYFNGSAAIDRAYNVGSVVPAFVIGKKSSSSIKPETPVVPDEPEVSEPIVHNGTIPEGGTYYVGITKDEVYVKDYEGATQILTAGDKFPIPQTGDVYVYGDYEYRYNLHHGDECWFLDEEFNGWGVRVLDITKSEYKEILTNIAGKNITNMDATFVMCESLVTAPEIPNSVTSMEFTFAYCTSLVNAPVIPDGVTNMEGIFACCPSLVNAPAIPDGVEDINSAFYECISLINPPVIPSSVTEMSGTFEGCTSLVSAPIIPDGVTNMWGTFAGCTSLVNAPVIPDGVTNMDSTFKNCTSLVNSPVIPSSVTNMARTFEGCTSLVNAPVIPDSVESLNSAFKNCTSLVNAPAIPCGKIENIFEGCVSLTGTIDISTNTHRYSKALSGTVKPITLTGSSNILNEIAATATNGNVTVKSSGTSEPDLGEEPTEEIITFKIDGNTYTSEDNMTLGEWINSDYNTLGQNYFYTDTGYVLKNENSDYLSQGDMELYSIYCVIEEDDNFDWIDSQSPLNLSIYDTITFTVEGTTYTSLRNMDWKHWLMFKSLSYSFNSKYDYEIYNGNQIVYLAQGLAKLNNGVWHVDISDVIINDDTYVFVQTSGGPNN